MHGPRHIRCWTPPRSRRLAEDTTLEDLATSIVVLCVAYIVSHHQDNERCFPIPHHSHQPPKPRPLVDIISLHHPCSQPPPHASKPSCLAPAITTKLYISLSVRCRYISLWGTVILVYQYQTNWHGQGSILSSKKNLVAKVKWHDNKLTYIGYVCFTSALKMISSMRMWK